MAAKGEASEHDLAQFAEKVRSTADRFNRLSTTFTSMAQVLLGSCYSLKEKLNVGTESDSGETDEIRRSISSIARALEERCNQLQERICCIGNEVHDVQGLVNQSIKSISEEGSREESPEAATDLPLEEDDSERTLERSVNAMEDEADGELVIDHGRLWGEEDNVIEKAASSDRHQSENFPLDDVAETPVDESEAEHASEEEIPAPADGIGEPETTEEMETVDIPGAEPEGEAEDKEFVIPSMEESPVEEGQFAEPETPSDQVAEAAEERPTGTDEARGDTAQHKWFKIDIDKEEEAADVASEEVKVREAAEIASEEIETDETADAGSEEMEAEETTGISVEGLDEPKVSDYPEQGQRDEEEAEAAEMDDGEPIYDLYDLGAIEYLEETITQH
jgi:hypothetical protein